MGKSRKKKPVKKLTNREAANLLAMLGINAISTRQQKGVGRNEADNIGKASAAEMLNLAVQAEHDPRALRDTGPVKGYLESIAKRIGEIGHVSAQQVTDAPRADDHAKYAATYCSDAAVISVAIQSGSAKFIYPLIGGEPYLRHVLRCQRCLHMMASDDTVFDDPVLEEALDRHLTAALPDLERLTKGKPQ